MFPPLNSCFSGLIVLVCYVVSAFYVAQLHNSSWLNLLRAHFVLLLPARTFFARGCKTFFCWNSNSNLKHLFYKSGIIILGVYVLSGSMYGVGVPKKICAKVDKQSFFFTCLKVALCKNWTPAECVCLLVSTVSCAASSLHGDLRALGECWSVHR